MMLVPRSSSVRQLRIYWSWAAGFASALVPANNTIQRRTRDKWRRNREVDLMWIELITYFIVVVVVVVESLLLLMLHRNAHSIGKVNNERCRVRLEPSNVPKKFICNFNVIRSLFSIHFLVVSRQWIETQMNHCSYVDAETRRSHFPGIKANFCRKKKLNSEIETVLRSSLLASSIRLRKHHPTCNEQPPKRRRNNETTINFLKKIIINKKTENEARTTRWQQHHAAADPLIGRAVCPILQFSGGFCFFAVFAVVFAKRLDLFSFCKQKQKCIIYLVSVAQRHTGGNFHLWENVRRINCGV